MKQKTKDICKQIGNLWVGIIAISFVLIITFLIISPLKKIGTPSQTYPETLATLVSPSPLFTAIFSVLLIIIVFIVYIIIKRDEKNVIRF